MPPIQHNQLGASLLLDTCKLENKQSGVKPACLSEFLLHHKWPLIMLILIYRYINFSHSNMISKQFT